MDEKNFPPLPIRTDTQSALHSRVSSFQSLPGSNERASTPRVPPGFETTHAHPEPAKAQETASTQTPVQKVTTAPVLPAVAIVPAMPRASTPKPTETDKGLSAKPKAYSDAPDLGPGLAVKRMASDISLGSPIREASRTINHPARSEKTSVQEKHKQESVTVSPLPSKISELKVKEMKRAPRPGKIDIPARISATADGPPVNTSGADKPAILSTSSVIATPPLISPRSATPATATSEASRSSVPRARTLRVTTSAAQKATAEPALQAATAEQSTSTFAPPAASSYPKLGAVSHQVPLSSTAKVEPQSQSLSRPSTPAMSEILASDDVSRASSPPPSIVGSAPERVKTKNQLKKERREKARTEIKSIDSSKDVLVPTPTAPTAEEVGPIVARQKKQKKSKSQPIESATVNVKGSEETPTETEDAEEDTKHHADDISGPESKPETPIQEGSPLEDESAIDEPSYTLRDLYADAAKIKPEARDKVNMIRIMLQHKIPQSSVPKIFSSMIASEDLTKDHPWFNPGGYSFNSAGYKLPTDSRKGQDYLDAHGYVGGSYAFGHVYLPVKEKRALERGSAVGIASSPAKADQSSNGKSNAIGKKGQNQNEQEDLLKRCLITPSGTVFRHLNAHEADKVLELEQRRQWYVEEFGEDVGGMHALEKPLEVDDYINLAGGMEELGRYGERHGIVWVNGAEEGDEEYDDGEEELDEMEEDAGLMSDEIDDLGIDLDPAAGMPSAWGEGQGGLSGIPPTTGQAPNTLAPMKTQPGPQAQNINLRALDVETLQRRVAEKQKELEAAKKEMEKIEKGMTKRNREFGKWRDAVLKA